MPAAIAASKGKGVSGAFMARNSTPRASARVRGGANGETARVAVPYDPGTPRLGRSLMETGDTPPQAVPLPGEAVPKEYPLEFTATAGEYFRIWIVNLALSVATLGIYSAWAKVRRKRYFHGCTHIDGDSFEYRGRPIPILKGRILAVAVAGTVYAVLHFTPLWFPAVLLAAVFVVPLLLVRSFAFNAHNTV